MNLNRRIRPKFTLRTPEEALPLGAPSSLTPPRPEVPSMNAELSKLQTENSALREQLHGLEHGCPGSIGPCRHLTNDDLKHAVQLINRMVDDHHMIDVISPSRDRPNLKKLVPLRPIEIRLSAGRLDFVDPNSNDDVSLSLSSPEGMEDYTSLCHGYIPNRFDQKYPNGIRFEVVDVDGVENMSAVEQGLLKTPAQGSAARLVKRLQGARAPARAAAGVALVSKEEGTAHLRVALGGYDGAATHKLVTRDRTLEIVAASERAVRLQEMRDAAVGAGADWGNFTLVQPPAVKISEPCEVVPAGTYHVRL